MTKRKMTKEEMQKVVTREKEEHRRKDRKAMIAELDNADAKAKAYWDEIHDSYQQGVLARNNGLSNHPCPQDDRLKLAWTNGYSLGA